MAQIKDLPIGARVVDLETKYYGQPIVWTIADKNHTGYPDNSVTLMSDRILCLKAFDAKEPRNPESNRANYGNNNYKNSNLLAWLNSTKTNNWYSAKHSYDNAPSGSNVTYNPYADEAGFLSNFSKNMRSAIVETSIKVARNTVTDGGGSETVTSKIFLASNTEAGLSNKGGIAEGSKLAMFDGDASRKALPTVEAVSKSNHTISSLNASSPWYWWLRTPYTSNPYNVRNVNTSGALFWGDAHYGTRGVRPLCNIKASVDVSGQTEDGVHILSFGPNILFKQNGQIQQVSNAQINGKNIVNIYVKDQNGKIRNIK